MTHDDAPGPCMHYVREVVVLLELSNISEPCLSNVDFGICALPGSGNVRMHHFYMAEVAYVAASIEQNLPLDPRGG